MNFPEYLFTYDYFYDSIVCYKLGSIYKDTRCSYDELMDSATYKKVDRHSGRSKEIWINEVSVFDFCLTFDEAIKQRNSYFKGEIDKINNEKKRLEKLLNKKIKNPLDKLDKNNCDKKEIKKPSCRTLKEATGMSLEDHYELFEKYVKGELTFEEMIAVKEKTAVKTKEDELERRIIDIVREEPGLTTMRIVSKLRQYDSNLSESLASQIVWRLIDSGELYLTDDCGTMINVEFKKRRKK